MVHGNESTRDKEKELFPQLGFIKESLGVTHNKGIIMCAKMKV